MRPKTFLLRRTDASRTLLCMSNCVALHGKTIREMLDARGIKYSWVADRLGISPSLMTRVMQGKAHLTPERRRRLAELLQIPEDLLSEDAP